MSVPIEPRFECVFSESHIFLLSLRACDSSLVNDGAPLARSADRAVGFHPTVAWLCHVCVLLRRGECLLIVPCNDGFYVWHAAVREFEGIPVQYLAEFVLWWEAAVDYVEEFSANVCVHTVTVRGVKPDDISSSPRFLGKGAGVKLICSE